MNVIVWKPKLASLEGRTVPLTREEGSGGGTNIPDKFKSIL